MNKQPLVYEVLQEASTYLEDHGCETQVAEWLLLHHLKTNRTNLFMQYREPVKSEQYDAFWQDINRHVKTYIPVQQLIGTSEFYGRTFQVNEHTLIPRPETEEVVLEAVYLAKKLLAQREELTIIDVGTGSGIIAITLALELGIQAKVYATDISEEALFVARENNRLHGTQVTFLHGNLLDPIVKRKIQPHLIVSNPPYIAEKERNTLSPVVLRHDPHLALFAEDEGLYFYKEMIQEVKRQNWSDLEGIVFEIGSTQGKPLANYIQRELANRKIRVKDDINKNERIFIIE